MTIWKGLALQEVRTSVDSDDPRLTGRTYTIPFATVWQAAIALTGGRLHGWRIARADDEIGIIMADVKGPLLPLEASVSVYVTLDANAQTRVDVWARGLHGGWGLGVHQRRVGSFFAALDRLLNVEPGQILDPRLFGPTDLPDPVEAVEQPGWRSASRRIVPPAMVAALLLGGCSENVPETAPPAGSGESVRAPLAARGLARESATGATYLRTVVFVDAASDTTMFVPWEFENRDEADGIHRVVRAWLGRGTQWSLFMEDAWVTQPSRAPWRVFPRGAARMVVGRDDAPRELYYQEGIRDLSVRFGEAAAEWSDPRVGTFRLLSATASLSGVESEGWIVDASTVYPADSDHAAEWAVLVGTDLQLLLAAPDGARTHRAWARLSAEDLSWPSVAITWAETRSFERARRDIPVLWRFESPDGGLSGELRPVSAHHRTLDGSGPVLPVLAVYEVHGHVLVNDSRVAVKGFLRHAQR
ncbi:MAG: hypothetical protein OXE96_03740 [Gemmatimonadetes bacterium]|nr:hypothetical protein [Gemmatimonadota bacterium]